MKRKTFFPPQPKKPELAYQPNSFISKVNSSYNFKIKSSAPYSNKTQLLNCVNGNCYILKKSTSDISNKFVFLSNLGIDNIIYPELNVLNNYISENQNEYYYVSNYYENRNTLPDKTAIDLFYELVNLHNKTSFPRQLDPEKCRYKFDEISKQLDYKFKLIEEYIRSLESKKIDQTIYKILNKYHIILNAKSELIRLQKRIILNIKDRESVNYVFIHNNPKVDHLIYVRGNKYLTSIENGKLGIESLDFAKYYVENLGLNIDSKKLICNELLKYETDFYYDYFRFLVLLIFIKRLAVSNNLLMTSESFSDTAINIDKFLKDFKDRVRSDED